MSSEASSTSDEELVRRAKAGDAQATRSLVERYAPMLRRQARQRLVGGLRRKVGESDVVQEACLAAFLNLEGFEDRGPGSFRRWLETIGANKAVEEVRRHLGAERRSVGREVSQSSGAEVVVPGTGDPTPSGAAAAAEDRAALRAALDALTGDDRIVLHLVHEQGKSFAEAGRVLGRSAEAARKLYGRAVIRLGKDLRRGGHGPAGTLPRGEP